jgi:hypothetical protein
MLTTGRFMFRDQANDLKCYFSVADEFSILEKTKPIMGALDFEIRA